MSVKAQLAEIRSRQRVRTPVPAPADSEVLRAAQAINPASDKVRPETPPPDRDVIATRLAAAFRDGREPDRRDVKHAALCLWDGKVPLAADSRVLTAYLEHVRSSNSRRLFRRLASAYLVSFPEDESGLLPVAHTLSAMAPTVGEPWDRAADDLLLFDPKQGPTRVAEIALAGKSTPSRVLEGHGISGLATESGFGEAAFLCGLNALRTRTPASPQEHLNRVEAWALRPDRTLIFDDHRGPLIDALVLPWAEADVPKQDRDRFLAFLLGLFGDPRLHHAEWPRYDESLALRTVIRWLTDQSLRQFFDVVDRSATVQHQWIYRRAFWEAVYRRNLISDAWVIFDPLGVNNARKVFGTETPYACWSDWVARGHSCLLLRIGGGVVAEWSHNGKCHIWRDQNDPTAPRLYQNRYAKDDARRMEVSNQGGLSITHSSPTTYNWQEKVADEIYAMTDIRVYKSEYEVPK